jgi:hypothetical protein
VVPIKLGANNKIISSNYSPHLKGKARQRLSFNKILHFSKLTNPPRHNPLREGELTQLLRQEWRLKDNPQI